MYLFTFYCDIFICSYDVYYPSYIFRRVVRQLIFSKPISSLHPIFYYMHCIDLKFVVTISTIFGSLVWIL